MTRQDIVRAWKDEEYRAGLTPAELARLPAHPAGPVELADAHLDAAAGGSATETPLNTSMASDPRCTNTPKCPSHIFGACPVIVAPVVRRPRPR